MRTPSPLDDPDTAAHAWARYKRFLRFTALAALPVVILALALLYARWGPVSIHFYVAAALGIAFIMLLTGALMGLVFLSSGTGHDASLIDRGGDDR